MKKISLKGISEILSEKELKNVMGGSGNEQKTCTLRCDQNSTSGESVPDCSAATFDRCTKVEGVHAVCVCA